MDENAGNIDGNEGSAGKGSWNARNWSGREGNAENKCGNANNQVRNEGCKLGWGSKESGWKCRGLG